MKIRQVQEKNSQSHELNNFSEKEKRRIAKLLRQPLRANLLKKRPAFAGKSAHYLDGGTSFSLANDIFGFDGWKSQIINSEIDFAREKQKNSDRWFVGVSVIVRVELKNGTYHEDLGFGEALNIKGRGAALQKAKKEAVTDATKRALRIFGNGLGNCLRLRWYQDALKKGKSFQDLQEESYRQGDLLDPDTGGRAVKKPEEPVFPEEKTEHPTNHELLLTDAMDKNSGEEDDLSCPFTQPVDDPIDPVRTNYKNNIVPPDATNSLKHSRDDFEAPIRGKRCRFGF